MVIRTGLRETWGMGKKERLLLVPRGSKLPGECNVCGQKFYEPDMLQKFNAHTCGEDFSQAAARIVKQATEDK
jgi:hypothetical protein